MGIYTSVGSLYLPAYGEAGATWWGRVNSSFGALDGLFHRGALISMSGVNSIANTTWTYIPYATEAYDTNGFFDVSSNTRILIPNSNIRKVQVAAGGLWESNGTGIRLVEIQKNRASFAGIPRSGILGASVGNAGQSTISMPISVASGDYFEVRVYQNISASLNYGVAGSLDYNWFGIKVIDYREE